MKKIKIWFENLNPTIQIFLVLLLLYILYKIYIEVKNLIFESRKQEEIDKEQKELVSAGQTLTYPRSQYLSMADLVYSAYFDSIFSTDYDMIKRVFTGLSNQLDYLELTTAYGKRRLLFSMSYVGMEVMLIDTLDSDEIKELKQILSNKNIRSFL